LRIFYGWWIVLAAFLNLFFAVGILFYGFPVFYPSMMQSLGFTRAQLTTGFLLGFVAGALPFGLLAGSLIDRLGARSVIWTGVWLVGLSMILMGSMTRLWQFYLLCVIEVIGYTLAGPIPNQVLIANWFQRKRGRAMGYAYLGLGVGGAISPLAIDKLIQSLGWRHALQVTGALVLIVLFPVAQWITKSNPRDLHLLPDGFPASLVARESAAVPPSDVLPVGMGTDLRRALESRNFWLIVAGCTLTIGAIGAVTQHLVLFLKDQGYSLRAASHVSSVLLGASLVGRVIVGYFADRRSKKNVMALFYVLLAVAIPLLFLNRPSAVWAFALIFGFALGADYMLIPLLTAECFGLSALGKLLSLIISGYSLGQWVAPWVTGKIFDAYHSYDLAWSIMVVAALLGAAIIYAIVPPGSCHHDGNGELGKVPIL
jgi:MFS family permease